MQRCSLELWGVCVGDGGKSPNFHKWWDSPIDHRYAHPFSNCKRKGALCLPARSGVHHVFMSEETKGN